MSSSKNPTAGATSQRLAKADSSVSNCVIKSVEGKEAKDLIKHFKEDLEELSAESKIITVTILEAKIVFQSRTTNDATLETFRDRVLEWLKDDEDVITTALKDEQRQIQECLSTKKNAITFKETKPGGKHVFRLQGRKRHVDVCMEELHKLLKRPYEPKTQIKLPKASVSVHSGTKADSNPQVPKHSVSQRSATGTVGQLAQGIETNSQSQTSAKGIKYDDQATEHQKSTTKGESTRLAKDKKVEPLVHVPHEESPGKHQAVYSANVPYKLDVSLKSGLIFRVYSADITALKIDSLVNPANEDLHNTGGCALAISKAAGKEFDDDCKRIIKFKKKINVTENVISKAGNLKCKYIINAVGPEWGKYDESKKVKCLEDLLKTVTNILQTAEKEKLATVAIPPISSGIFAVPVDICASMYVKAITDFDTKKRAYLREVHLVDLDPDSAIIDLASDAYHTYLKEPKSLDPKVVLQRHSQQASPGTKSGNGAAKSTNGATKSTTNGVRSKVIENESRPRCQNEVKDENGRYVFEMDNMLKIFIYKENIVTLKNIGILVCPENTAVTVTGGLAKNIYRNAGQKYHKQLKRVQDELGGKRFHPGDIRVLPAGNLKYRFVLLTVINRFSHERAPHDDELLELKHTTKLVLDHSDYLVSGTEKRKASEHLESLAMPLLGAGTITDPRHLEMLCSYVYFGIESYLNNKRNAALREIHLVSFNDNTNAAFIKVFMDESAGGYKRVRPHPITPRPASADMRRQMVFTKNSAPVEIWSMSDEKRSLPNIKNFFQKPTDKSLDTCVICLEQHTKPAELKICRHVFCEDCICEFLKRKYACPICNAVYGKLYGDQPQTGRATVYLENSALPGYHKTDTWIIFYEFPDGVQNPNHPNPGYPYKGTRRIAYLPNNEKGTAVLRMLEKAFKQGLTFTVGSSRTTGRSNIVTWNDIHHKTNRTGGPERFGYPDDNYLERVREELEAKGIKDNEERVQQ